MAKRTKPQVGSSGPVPGEPKPMQKRRLTWAQERFVEAFIQNKGNATQAYRLSHPGCSYETAAQGGASALKQPHILAAIDAQREADRNLLNFQREDALKLLLAMATASLDDFTPIFRDVENRKNYRGLGLKRMALESAKRTEKWDAGGGKTVTNEVKIISPSERRAVINDLWDKLGFDKQVSKANWFDGFDKLAELISGTKKSE